MSPYRLVALACVLLLSACATRTRRAPPLLAPCPVQAPAPGVPVSALVITTAQGTGNPLWTQDYLEQLLASASTRVARPGLFYLDRRVEHASDTLYALGQIPLATAVCFGMPPEQFAVIISTPLSTDSAGATPSFSGGGSPSCFVMRSRHFLATPDAIAATASILVHELGHVVGYGEAPGGADGIHADNWATTPEGQARLTAFQEKILRRCH